MSARTTVPVQLLPNLSVQLTDRPLLDLMAAAEQGYRLYELFALQGENDLVHFVDACLSSDTPQAFPWWPSWHWEQAPGEPWRFPLDEWAPPFRPPLPEHQAWLAFHADAPARELARPHWPSILAARDHVRRSTDPLVQDELDLIDRRVHPNDIALELDRLSPWLQRWFRWSPSPAYSARQYALLSELLSLPLIQAFSHRGRGDMAAIRCAVNEQRRRRGATQSHESELFPIRVLSGWSGNSCFDPDDDVRVMLDWLPAWMRGVRLQFEGLNIEGLFFDENGVGGQSPAQMERTRLRAGVPLILVDTLDPDRTRLRHWFNLGERWWLGVIPEARDALWPVLDRFGATEVEATQ